MRMKLYFKIPWRIISSFSKKDVGGKYEWFYIDGTAGI